MTDRELMQMALDALEAAYHPDTKAGEVMEALRTRLSQCERCGEANPAEIHTCSPQAPVAWMYNGNLHEFDPSDWAEGEVIPLYTAPPQREWQGLTDEDWIIGKRSADYIAGAEWAEAKLKEKNSA
jgi:hypothetical protein